MVPIKSVYFESGSKRLVLKADLQSAARARRQYDLLQSKRVFAHHSVHGLL